ncbi:tripartite tricarboxylate transporter TctB family protein [Aidingimonas halophila]|uniref:Putative tricarboxylic transport membrane protein n=1 Tax=Aidingimonas halophila TaxID=574349 RepID=A0A1H3DB62_9GAMM|nr:tripartite tricarboxylate transporter TctB family protein [Aidingimonas halophila]GHC30233.1 hypothetical protein GCM10008094_23120 [Aidingimonas halophila]SDX63597.1 putative tricarboxylic transport membrane protein [Aidingimonas halophila]
MSRLNVNQILALILAVFSVIFLIGAYQIPAFALPRPVDSDMFPKVLGYSLLILSGMLFLEKPQERDIPDADAQAESARLPLLLRPWSRVIITAIAIAAYALLLEPLGFVLASTLLSVGLTIYYGYRRHAINLAVSLGVVLALYLTMTKFMNVHLPPGVLPI